MIDPFGWIEEESRKRLNLGLRRTLVVRDDSASLVNFGSNDYLGLAADPRLKEAAIEAVHRFGWGSGASPLVSGWTELHERLVQALARFEGTDRALLFPTGYAANVGTIASLVESGDAVYCDRLNHASIIDGIRLSGASPRIYPHNDTDRLASILERDQGRFRRSLIVTDGVFSMDGDLAPLPALADLAERFSAMLMVDEAHGTGVFGPTGRGASEALGVTERVPIKVGTLSKGLGSIGGFVAGSDPLIEQILHRARSLIYSTAMPAAAAAASLAALAIVDQEPWRRTRVFELGAALRKSMDLCPSTVGPIVPILVGEPEAAVSLARRLRERGYFVPAIRPPTVPKGTSRLRISLSASHTTDQLEGLIQSLRERG